MSQTLKISGQNHPYLTVAERQASDPGAERWTPERYGQADLSAHNHELKLCGGSSGNHSTNDETQLLPQGQYHKIVGRLTRIL